MSWRAIHIPWFGIAVVGSLTAWLAFVVWILLDASFDRLLQQIRIDLRLHMSPGIGVLGIHNELGQRMLAFGMLTLLAVVSTLFVLGRLSFASSEARSWRALMFAVALVGLWLLLLKSSDALVEAGLRLRVRRALPALKADAAILLADWPTTKGSLPFAGNYAISEESNLLWILPKPQQISYYPTGEAIGPCIWKSEDGSLRFDYLSNDTVAAVEFRPQSDEPVSFKHAFRFLGKDMQTLEHVMEKYVQLEPDWFLVWYSVHELGEAIK